ncbi:MAG: DUF4131 domain-containing protein [Thermoleophilia bacterium]
MPAILVLLALAAARGPARARLLLLAGATAGLGLWWGGIRVERLDASALRPLIGEAHAFEAVVADAARVGRFDVRMAVDVRRLDGAALREPVQLELPAAVDALPPVGAVVAFHATVVAPRPADEAGGFDEASVLARRGAHVVLRATRVEQIGWRGGVLGLGDRVRDRIRVGLDRGVQGERGALVAGIVLGQDEGLSDELRDRFRAAGLTHLLRYNVIVLIG